MGTCVLENHKDEMQKNHIKKFMRNKEFKKDIKHEILSSIH